MGWCSVRRPAGDADCHTLTRCSVTLHVHRSRCSRPAVAIPEVCWVWWQWRPSACHSSRASWRTRGGSGARAPATRHGRRGARVVAAGQFGEVNRDRVWLTGSGREEERDFISMRRPVVMVGTVEWPVCSPTWDMLNFASGRCRLGGGENWRRSWVPYSWHLARSDSTGSSILYRGPCLLVVTC